MLNQIVTYPAIPPTATSVTTLSAAPVLSGLAWDETLNQESDPYFDPVRWMPTLQEGSSIESVVVVSPAGPKPTAFSRQR